MGDGQRAEATWFTSPASNLTNQIESEHMGFLDSILGGQNQTANETGGANPLLGVLTGLLAQSGGLQGLLSKFSQAGHDDKVKSWISTGENQPIEPHEVQDALGHDQISALAAKLGVDPAQASQLLAKFLPNVVDKLTPNGHVDSSADHSQNLAGLLPSLLQNFGGGNLSNIFGSAPAEEEAAAG
jgi:uncharacterized protein YidB (DUF937 family)